MELSNDEKELLLKAARKSISSKFGQTDLPQFDPAAYPKLKEKLGAFVTLKINNNLRGCIGYIVGQKPLFDTVVEAAEQSAFSDPRFPQLAKKELENVQIEISVLSHFTAIESYDEIEVGKHGLLLDEGGRALLLPQVATEHNYDRSQFLTSLCHKAGLYGEYWKERILKLKVFTALVFGED